MAEKKAEKINIVEKLDELFESMLDEATKKPDAGVGNEAKVPLETKIEIFKEGVRWAAVKNKLPDPSIDSPLSPGADGGRLGKIKKGLSRR